MEAGILLWLGREDVGDENKEGFIQALTEFQDGCKHFLSKEKLDRSFYGYRAYFLAAAGITEFPKYSQTDTDKIVKKVIDWGYGVNEIKMEAQAVLLQTPRKNTINALGQLLRST
ncbi:MAG: hypothetical protein F6K39_32020, partial [Okeania sp. SIO3B3]|nr:hypothetical protein [Okeania sp. SIO3B3]